MGNYYGSMFGWDLGGGSMMILFLAAIIIFIVWATGEISGKNNSDKIHYSKSVLDILNERYAKGEIDKKEFEEKKKDLSNSL